MKNNLKKVVFEWPGAGAIGVELKEVSPEMAEAWLAGQKKNRKIRRRHVEALKRDMLRGDWRLTGQGISVDSEGCLIDGQHRLTAVVEAGVGVPMFVFSGFAAELQSSMDLGAVRSVAEMLGMEGAVNCNVLVSYTNAISRGLLGYKNKLSLQQVKLMLEALPQVPLAVLQDSPKLQVRQSAYLGIIAVALHLKGKDAKVRVARFWDAVTKGLGIDSETHPAYRLREYVRANGSSFGGGRSLVAASFTMDCLQAWMKGEPMPATRATNTGRDWLRLELGSKYDELRGILRV